MAVKFLLGQWVLDIELAPTNLSALQREVMEAGDRSGGIPIVRYAISNPDPVSGKRRFYEAAPGQYGQPLIREEPDGGLRVPAGLTYVDPWGSAVDPSKLLDPRIVGAIFQQKDGRIAMGSDGKPLRFSFSNPDAPEMAELSSDGSVTVGGEKWHLVRLHQANQNRIVGLVGFFRKERPGHVIVSELAHVGV
ncbi:MAG: hypothetical protein EBZ48_07645 [Proteobacteria bacterium]|nr:hypothetical protein [Pseudomonadota bacterium]